MEKVKIKKQKPVIISGAKMNENGVLNSFNGEKIPINSYIPEPSLSKFVDETEFRQTEGGNYFTNKWLVVSKFMPAELAELATNKVTAHLRTLNDDSLIPTGVESEVIPLCILKYNNPDFPDVVALSAENKIVGINSPAYDYLVTNIPGLTFHYREKRILVLKSDGVYAGLIISEELEKDFINNNLIPPPPKYPGILEPSLNPEVVYSDYYRMAIPKDSAVATVEGWVHEDDLDNFTEIAGEYHHNDDIFESDLTGEWHSNEDIVWDYDKEVCGTEDEFLADSSYYEVSYGQAENCYLHENVIGYCEDIGDYVHEDDTISCPECGEFYYYEDHALECCGHNNSPDYIVGYHNSESPDDLSNGSEYRIGFEIEKLSFDGMSSKGDYIAENNLFSGYEEDSSCGVEAITHILPLDNAEGREEVFQLFDLYSWIINSESDLSCGGHITVSVKNEFDSLYLAGKLRPYLSLLYSLFRYRLKNNYCKNNKAIKDNQHEKYSPVNSRGGGALEIRIFSRVQDVAQLKNRYDLMYILIKSAMAGESYATFLHRAKQILLKMYDNNVSKVESLILLSYDFRDYLLLDKVSGRIHEFINPTNYDEEED